MRMHFNYLVNEIIFPSVYMVFISSKPKKYNYK